MHQCQTGVSHNGTLRACGEPTTETVMVGTIQCHYCATHAAAARRFVEKQGRERISALQQATNRSRQP